MINPSRVHRVKGRIVRLGHSPGHGEYIVEGIKHRSTFTGWDCPVNLQVGDVVNVQVRFSIMTDRYYIQTINKAPARFQPRNNLRLVG